MFVLTNRRHINCVANTEPTVTNAVDGGPGAIGLARVVGLCGSRAALIAEVTREVGARADRCVGHRAVRVRQRGCTGHTAAVKLFYFSHTNTQEMH